MDSVCLLAVSGKTLSCVQDATVDPSCVIEEGYRRVRGKGKPLTRRSTETVCSTVYCSAFTPPLKTGFCKLKGGDRMRTPEVSAQDWLEKRWGGQRHNGPV